MAKVLEMRPATAKMVVNEVLMLAVVWGVFLKDKSLKELKVFELS